MYNVPAFRAFMKELIGDRTQLEFAAEKGITSVHLSRMMRSEKPPRPSKDTLKKIAGGSDGVYEELLSLCGYRGEETQVILETKEDKAKKRMEELRDGLRDMTKAVRVYDSLTDFLEEYTLLYDSKNASFTTGRKVEYDEGDHYNAEYAVPVTVSYMIGSYECRIFVVLYFSETKGGRVIVLDSAMDGKSIVRAGMLLSEENRKKVEELPCLYLFRRDESAEEKLLKAIFEGGDIETVISSVIGFGFRFESRMISDEAIRKFVASHIDTYEGAVKEYADRVFSSANAKEVLKDYYDDMDLGNGTGAYIAETMRSETGIGFSYYEDVTGNPDAVSAIMIERKDYDLYDIDDMKDAASRYAKQLGIPECGEYLVYIHDYIDTDMRITTTKEEE